MNKTCKYVSRIAFICVTLAFLAPNASKAGFLQGGDNQHGTAKNFLVNDAVGTPMQSYAITSGNSAYTQKLGVMDNMGYQSILVKVNGNINIVQEVSIDGITWYPPMTSDGANLTDISGIVTNLTADTWIITPAHLTYYTRFRIDANSNSTITFYYVYIS